MQSQADFWVKYWWPTKATVPKLTICQYFLHGGLWVTIKWSFHVNSPSNTRSSQQETVHVRRVLIDWKYYVAPRCSVQEVMMSWFLIWYQHNMDFDTLPFHRRRESDEAQTSFARCNVVINNNIKEVLFDCSQSYGSSICVHIQHTVMTDVLLVWVNGALH